jgi:hypothetical protein
VQRLHKTVATLGLATIAAVAWIVTEGASLASATTRYRSGTFRTQLAGHYGGGAPAPTPGGLMATGADVMAAIVALLAVMAFAFLVVTFIRRRTTVATG